MEYGTILDIAPYMSDKRSPPVLYQLYGVLVHYGHSVNSGHYFCFVRAPNQTWYQMDDDNVSQVGLHTRFSRASGNRRQVLGLGGSPLG